MLRSPKYNYFLDYHQADTFTSPNEYRVMSPLARGLLHGHITHATAQARRASWVLWCHQPEILNFWTEAPHIPVTLGLTHDTTCLLVPFTLLKLVDNPLYLSYFTLANSITQVNCSFLILFYFLGFQDTSIFLSQSLLLPSFCHLCLLPLTTNVGHIFFFIGSLFHYLRESHDFKYCLHANAVNSQLQTHRPNSLLDLSFGS